MLVTARLVLRPFRAADHEPFAALNADPAVMEFFPNPLNRQQSDAIIARLTANRARDGFGVWAVEAAGAFIGMVGLARVPDDLPCAPAVEVLWRLHGAAWGQGYATEAARAAINDGLQQHGIAEIVAFTPTFNQRSQAVMRKLGMRHDPGDDFDHPRLAEGHRLRRHVLYRLKTGGGGDAVR
jgi:ribosomal-protein-alanine N-acetyltransferase